MSREVRHLWLRCPSPCRQGPSEDTHIFHLSNKEKWYTARRLLCVYLLGLPHQAPQGE